MMINENVYPLYLTVLNEYVLWFTVMNDNILTHWGRVTHIWVNNPTIIGSYNGLSPSRHQAIIWTNAGILLIRPLGTNLWNINRNSYIFIQENAFQKVVWEMAAILSRLQCVNQIVINSHNLLMEN